MIVTVVSSPFDEDASEPLPWNYEGEDFIAWVDEVLLDGGRVAPCPDSVDVAIEIAETVGYGIETRG